MDYDTISNLATFVMQVAVLMAFYATFFRVHTAARLQMANAGARPHLPFVATTKPSSL